MMNIQDSKPWMGAPQKAGFIWPHCLLHPRRLSKRVGAESLHFTLQWTSFANVGRMNLYLVTNNQSLLKYHAKVIYVALSV
jgi:hypothetical protein